MIAAAWALPSLLAKSGGAAAPTPVVLRAEPRAVARKGGSY
jgi:hypothetical protein